MPSRRSPRATASAMRGSSSATRILTRRHARRGPSSADQPSLCGADERGASVVAHAPEPRGGSRDRIDEASPLRRRADRRRGAGRRRPGRPRRDRRPQRRRGHERQHPDDPAVHPGPARHAEAWRLPGARRQRRPGQPGQHGAGHLDHPRALPLMSAARLETAALEDPRAGLEEALYELKRVIVGQDAMLERLLVALLAGGHVLLEGVPGLAKTLTVKTLASVLGGSFRRVQFTPDLVPSDLVGTRVYRPDT